jgi:hypothetical protein
MEIIHTIDAMHAPTIKGLGLLQPWAIYTRGI